MMVYTLLSVQKMKHKNKNQMSFSSVIGIEFSKGSSKEFNQYIYYLIYRKLEMCNQY